MLHLHRVNFHVITCKAGVSRSNVWGSQRMLLLWDWTHLFFQVLTFSELQLKESGVFPYITSTSFNTGKCRFLIIPHASKLTTYTNKKGTNVKLKSALQTCWTEDYPKCSHGFQNAPLAEPLQEKKQTDRHPHGKSGGHRHHTYKKEENNQLSQLVKTPT